MAKRVIILLTFLAYSLTLVHSLVPHHHDETVQVHTHDDHHSGDHQHENDSDDNTLSHFFSDAVHHPSAEIFIHSSKQENVQKAKTLSSVFILMPGQLLLPELKPPDNPDYDTPGVYSFDHFSISLLRAPPKV
jgi:hypothetical protein